MHILVGVNKSPFHKLGPPVSLISNNKSGTLSVMFINAGHLPSQDLITQVTNYLPPSNEKLHNGLPIIQERANVLLCLIV